MGANWLLRDFTIACPAGQAVCSRVKYLDILFSNPDGHGTILAHAASGGFVLHKLKLQ
jgi:hypothetical protein